MMYGSTIHHGHGYDANSFTYYPVVIIGAGESGIAMGCRLKEVLGFDQFRIFDRQSGLGGTWWINRYPGAACDIPAIFYSFSFAQNPDWTSLHSSASEIIRYLQGVCEKYEIVDKIQLNTDVKQCRWNESEGLWDVTLQHLTVGHGDLSACERQQKINEHGREAIDLREERIRTKVLVSAVGALVEPKTLPDNIPGRDKFQGEIFHSARWKYDADLKGKDVVVVGTGCSAAQFVPRLTKEYGAKSVTQLMRSPPWVVPSPEPPFGEEKWKKWVPWLNRNIPGLQRTLRACIAARSEYDWRLFGNSEYSAKERTKVEKVLIAHMKRTVPQKYWEILTPDYGVCCKRRILDCSWFPSLNDPNIELTTLKLSTINEKSITLGPGRAYPNPANGTSQAPDHEVTVPADVIVLANGFEILRWFHPLDVIGRDGKKLHEVFDERGGPQMYMGMAMDGFPNFFVIFGPNTVTGHSSVILASENMVNMSLKFIKPILDGDVAQVEVKKEAELDWSADIQKACKETVFHTGGCVSWYKTDSGWNSTTYPYSQIWFTLRCMFPTWSDWDIRYTPKGLAKRKTKSAVRYMTYALAIVSIYHARQHGFSVWDVPALIRSYTKVAMLMGANALQRIAGKL